MLWLRPSEDELLDWFMWIVGPALTLYFLSVKKEGYQISVFKWLIWISGCRKKMLCAQLFFSLRRVVLKYPFKSGNASKAWFEGFLSRNPQLPIYIHHTQPLSMARATSANKETITDFLISLIPCMQNLTSLPC